jgi:hyperosmotically inducible protein
MNRNVPIFALATFLAAGSAWATPVPQDGQTQPDNTKVNQRDKNPGEATADNQKGNADDLALTAKIRKAVMADKSLSTYAHNIKIISQNGTVTLKGPVQSDAEVKALMAKAADATGSASKVVNQLDVKQ